MAVIHLHGSDEEIDFFINFIEKNFNKKFYKKTDFNEALAKINPKFSYIFINFVKSQRYQIYCKTSQYHMHHITIVFGEINNPEAPKVENKFDIPLLKIENREISETEILFIQKTLKLERIV